MYYRHSNMPFVRKHRKVVRKRRPARRVRKAGHRPFARSGRSLIANPMGQYGTVTETISLTDVLANSPELYEMRLALFPRSQAVTALYQFYRLKYVEYKYIPKYPMGTQVAPGVTTGLEYGRPMRLYYMMNRLGTEPTGLALSNFEEKGCKPIPLGDSRSRAVVVKYKPNLTDALTSDGTTTTPLTGNAISPVFNKWLNRYYTNQSSGAPGPDADNVTPDWQGHFLWVDDFNQIANTAPIAEVRVTAVWEYKNPYLPVEGGEAGAKPLIIKTKA